MIRSILTLLLVLALSNNSDCYELKRGVSPPEDYLAVADGINPGVDTNRITMNRYRTLMDTLSKRLDIDRDRILAQCYKVKQVLEEKGIKESCLNVMEAIFRSTNLDQAKSFAGYAADYTVLRQSGLSHDKTVDFMTGPLYELFKFRTD